MKKTPALFILLLSSYGTNLFLHSNSCNAEQRYTFFHSNSCNACEKCSALSISAPVPPFHSAFDATARTLGEVFLLVALSHDLDAPPIFAQAYSTSHSSTDSPLFNISPDGKQLTYRGVMLSADRDLWSIAHGE